MQSKMCPTGILVVYVNGIKGEEIITVIYLGYQCFPPLDNLVLVGAVKIFNIGTCRSEQTVKTQIRLLRAV